MDSIGLISNYRYNIPEEMQRDSNWVWVSPTSKVPLQTSGRPASSSDPATWTSFENAVSHLPNNYFLGYAFAENSGIIGIDIDDGYTDGYLSELAIDLILRCKSYTETSRSGRGFHIILKGKLPFAGRNNRRGLEAYASGRYFICTANTMFYSSIIENQTAIDYMVEKYFKDTSDQLTLDDISFQDAYYKRVWEEGSEGRIRIKPTYPPILQGARNTSLMSLAGQLVTDGYTDEMLLDELKTANTEACEKPLPLYELKQIIKSVRRYKR